MNIKFSNGTIRFHIDCDAKDLPEVIRALQGAALLPPLMHVAPVTEKESQRIEHGVLPEMVALSDKCSVFGLKTATLPPSPEHIKGSNEVFQSTEKNPGRSRMPERDAKILNWMHAQHRMVSPAEIHKQFESDFPSYAAMGQWLYRQRDLHKIVSVGRGYYRISVNYKPEEVNQESVVSSPG